MHPVIRKQLLRYARPYLPEIIETLEHSIQDYKHQIPLEEGETHPGGVIHEQQGKVFLVICAFRDNQITRKIKVIPLKEISKLLEDE